MDEAGGCFGLILLAALFGCSSYAHAEFITGNTLYNWCQYDRRSAAAYITGVADAAENENTSRVAREVGLKPLICIPPRVEASQLVDIVCADLAKGAAYREKGAQPITAVSLMLVWPCK
jgi:hypothetical protein